MKTYQLINKETNQSESIFVSTSEDMEYNLNGFLLEPNGWKIDDKPCDCTFVASLYIKWDGCSHFYFYGDDYANYLEPEKDSYYHICGFESYIRHFRNIVFAWKLASELTSHMDKDEIRKYNNFKSQMDLLEGYEIKEIDVSEDDDLHHCIIKVLENE